MFLYITNFCQSFHNFKQRYPCMFMHRVTTTYIFRCIFCNDKRNYITMSHKNHKEQNLSMVSHILTSVKEITLVKWMLPARTPKDRTLVLVTSDILKMEATAKVLDTFLLQPFPLGRKALSSLRDLFYQYTLYKKEMNVGLKTMAIMTPL